LAAVVTLTSIAAASQVQACKGGGGGGGYSGGCSSSSYRGHNGFGSSSYGGYSAPVQRYAPSYSTPAYYSQPQQVIHPRPVQQQFVQQAPQTISVRPAQQISQQQQIAPQQAAQAPQQQTSPQQQAPQQQVQQPQTQAPVNAQISAQQALGGFAPPAATPQQQQVQTPAHVGNWTATLGNGATVQRCNGATVRLSLQVDGNFNWVATNKTGSQSSFSGSYTVSNGSLILNRSNDSQQLGGAMTISNTNAFSFKVAGSNAASINFSRS
jgi:hypothetical protein